jgi:hypothetical protein
VDFEKDSPAVGIRTSVGAPQSTKGRSRITAEDGTTDEFGVGDIMAFQAGARETFDVLEDSEDYFVAATPAESA